MSIGELTDKLRAEGLHVTPAMIRYAIRVGKIEVTRDYHRNFVFFTSHFEALRAIFAKKRKPSTAQVLQGGHA